MGTVPISTTISAQQLFSIAIFLKDPAMFSMQGIIILTILVSSFNVKGDSGLIEVQDRYQRSVGIGVFEECFIRCKGLKIHNVEFSCVSLCCHNKLINSYDTKNPLIGNGK